MENTQDSRLWGPPDSRTINFTCKLVCPSDISTNNNSPGQSLPDFPPPTHGAPPLPPYVSLASAISDINPNDRLHDIRPFSTPRYSVIDPYMPLPATIKTSNSTLIFPDGTRPFTKRELARCQTFSDAHIFGESNVERHSWTHVEMRSNNSW